jgi:hypothetical protein
MKAMKNDIETACFEDYLKHLREKFVNLVEYREMTGTLKPNMREVKEALFDEDPFVMFSASIIATVLLGDKFIYH